MNERIALVTLFNQGGIEKINSFFQTIEEPLCKIPFGKNVNDRIKVDTLPYHLTISAWDIEKKDEILKELAPINFPKFSIHVDSIQIMNGKENSYVLYFNIEPNNELKLLHETIYSVLPSERHNPAHVHFHITITIEKDYEKIIRIKKELEKNFTPFNLDINRLGLFSIYPANLIKIINSN